MLHFVIQTRVDGLPVSVAPPSTEIHEIESLLCSARKLVMRWLLAPVAPDVEEAGSQPNPLAADNGDESLSLVGAESPAGQGQASNRE